MVDEKVSTEMRDFVLLTDSFNYMKSQHPLKHTVHWYLKEQQQKDKRAAVWSCEHRKK